ncbi:MAG: transposase [Nitrososphaerota archaeon]
MRMSKHPPEEKLQAVMESLATTAPRQRYAGGTVYFQLIKWKQQFLEGGKEALSRNRRGNEREEEIESLKKIIGEQSLVIDAFKKRLQGRTR